MKNIRYIPIAITPRSGSTAFCSCLEVAGLAEHIGEIFNPAGPKQRFQNLLSVESDIELLEGCATLSYNQQSAVFKVSAADFKAVAKANSSIPNLLKGQWVYIDRDDKVAQGISMFVAKKTGNWHVRSDDNSGPFAEVQIPYDFQAIDEEVTRCEQEAEFWEKYFKENQVTPIRVRYEEFAEDPETTVKHVMRELHIQAPKVSVDSKTSVLPVFGLLAKFFDRMACRRSQIQPKYKKISDANTVHNYKVRYARDKARQAKPNRE